MKLSLGSILPVIFVIIFSFWTIKPLLHPGFFPMHDDTQVSRVYEMAKSLTFGQFPVRWVEDLGYGYGYPLFNFYAPLPYYIGAFFNIIGFDALTATKIMFLVGILLAAVTMYYLLNNIVGKIGASVGSLLYMYAPYHAVDIYVRGAVGEFYALAFLPLVLLGVVKIMRSTYSSSDPPAGGESRSFIGNSSRQASTIKQGIIICSLGFTGILLSHNIMGMITGYFLMVFFGIYLVYLIIKSKNLSTFYFLLSTFLLGLGLSSFFTLPAILEKDFTRVDELITGGSQFVNHFIYPDQFWNSPWGYAGSAPGRTDGMSFMIGKIHLLFALFSGGLILFFRRIKKVNTYHLSLITLLLIIFGISVFLMLEQSKSVWGLLPGFPFIQYPWRFLAFSVFAISIIASMSFRLMHKKIEIFVGLLMIAAVIIFNSKYFAPKEYLNVTPADYISDLNLRWKISKISDEYLPTDFVIPISPQGIALQGMNASQDMKIIGSVDNFTHKIYQVETYKQISLETNITYFPGWRAYIDNQYTPIQSKNGRIELIIPKGQHEVEFIFKDTPVRKTANTISILSVFLLGYIIISAKIYAKKKNS